MRKETKVVGVKIHCDKCNHNAVGTEAHVGRHHKVCGKSESGERRNVHGRWQSGHKEGR